jgi:hypothetical protein
MNKITEALEKLFTKHRVIFWYDEKQELIDQYTEVVLVDVIKLHVQNDEFQVKHNVVIQNPDKNFLLYFTTEKPIKLNEKPGGIIKALPYDSLFGRVNIGATTQNASFIFEPINKRP